MSHDNWENFRRLGSRSSVVDAKKVEDRHKMLILSYLAKTIIHFMNTRLISSIILGSSSGSTTTTSTARVDHP
jgi:hypothetical protein